MKKILIVGAIVFMVPFMSFVSNVNADAGEDHSSSQGEMMSTEESSVTGEEMMGEEENSMMGGLDYWENGMGGNMMWMNMLHGLIGLTSLVWLIAGVLFLYNQITRRKESDSLIK